MTPALTTPDWSKGAVWYQVMVDRFRNGAPGDAPDSVRPWRSAWFEDSDHEKRGSEAARRRSVLRRRYGGDLRGLINQLDYICGLGVTAVYLNPVFQARSYHKYDASSFIHIDRSFGGGQARPRAEEDLLDPSTWTWTKGDLLFREFLRAAHQRGLRVIIDAVFNHVGTRHPAFLDVKRRGPDSPYAEWFDVRSWKPFRYSGWWGHSELPVFKKSKRGFASDAVKQHLLAVTQRWMDPDGDGDPSDGVDGWRLDVPNEIPAPFWEEWRALVKTINSDAYISGEIWERADEWLDGRHFDAVMNYPFARAVIAWIGNRRLKITPSELDRRLGALRGAYPLDATMSLMNLVGSHDTDRLASMLKNPDREYDTDNRIQDGALYDDRRPGPIHYKRARLVALLQMTYVGSPMVYYGDEVGMFGSSDPTCRKPMLWSDLQPYDDPDNDFVDEAQLSWYRRVIGLRRQHPALARGSFETLLTDDEQDVWAFQRQDDQERVVVALGASERTARVRLPALGRGEWSPLLGDPRADAGAEVRIPRSGGRLWVQRR